MKGLVLSIAVLLAGCTATTLTTDKSEVVSPAVTSDSPSTKEKESVHSLVNGIWTGKVEVSAVGEGTLTMELVQNGQFVSGTFDASVHGRRLYDKVSGHINNRTLNLKFKNAPDWAGLTAEISYDGKTMAGSGAISYQFRFSLTKR